MSCWPKCVFVFAMKIVQYSCSVASLQLHGLQHVRLPCPSPTPRACSNSCVSSQWCHPTISSSVCIYYFILAVSYFYLVKKKKNDLNVFYLYIYSLPCLNEDLSNFPDLNKAIWSSLHKSALSTSWRTHGDGQLPALGKGASLLFAHCGFSLP